MRSLRNILVVLVAAAWLPMTMHCRLEALPGLEFLACESDSNSDGKQTSDCGDTGCCSAEHSQYKTERYRSTLPTLDFLLLPFVPLPDLADALSAEVGRDALTVAPPELPKCWQFVFRTASPPRAPSFVS